VPPNKVNETAKYSKELSQDASKAEMFVNG